MVDGYVPLGVNKNLIDPSDAPDQCAFHLVQIGLREMEIMLKNFIIILHFFIKTLSWGQTWCQKMLII